MDAVFSVPWLYSELANATAASGEGTQTSGPSNEAQIIFDAITSNSKPVCTKKSANNLSKKYFGYSP